MNRPQERPAARLASDASVFAPKSGAPIGFDPRAAPMYLLERRPKPDVGNLINEQARAPFTGEPAGHT